MSESGKGVDPSKGALTPTPLARPPAVIRPPRGGEEVRHEDIRLAVWRFLQATSTDVRSGEAKAGFLRNSATGEIRETLEFIPIYMKETRVHFEPKKPNNPPLCMSVDMIHGTSCACGCNNSCKDCAFCRWIPDPQTKRREPPQCSVTYNYISIMLQDLEQSLISPSVIRFAKSSTAAAQKIISLTAMTRRQDPQTKEIRLLNLWDFVWVIRLISKDFPGGPAFIADVQRGRPITEIEAAYAESIYEEILRARQIEIQEMEEAPA